ncbi:DUF5615 family PIN-like protein [Leptolyngbya sp. FACHB-261]|uniref:DUF5615 family PIN-like protein n=1 Tax=Leptolyngbya sp. FACHB-261 TaxID=2692806 RepID=UPI0037BF0C52
MFNTACSFFPGCGHVQFHLVTQDADFIERTRLYDSPLKVIWLRLVMHERLMRKQSFALRLRQFKIL